MDLIKVDESSKLNEIIKKINFELYKNQKDSIGAITSGLFNNKEIWKILILNSPTFCYLYLINSKEFELLISYISKIKSSSLEIQKNGMINFDFDHKKSKEVVSTFDSVDQIKNIHSVALEQSGKKILIYDKSNISMKANEAYETLILLRQAVKLYDSIYAKNKLIGKLSDDKIVYIKIRINELLHILGITKSQVLSNKEAIDILNIKDPKIRSDELLFKIINDINGNCNIITHHEDTLRRIARKQFDETTQTQILPFHKIRMKSLSFINSGPISNNKLICPILPNHRLVPSSKSNLALISKNSLSGKYDWLYIGSVYHDYQCYTETLVVDSSAAQFHKFKGQIPAILKSISVEGEVQIKNTFTEEEQLKFIEMAIEDFGGEGGMNFGPLLGYYKGRSK